MINCTHDHLASATVVGMHWERITVLIDVRVEFAPGVSQNEPLQFYAVNGLYSAKALFQASRLEPNLYRLSLNLTNPGDLRCLPVGTYSIVMCRGEQILSTAVVEPEFTAKLEDCSRNFLYNGRKKVYTVTFLVREGEEDLPFIMYILAAKRTGMGFPTDGGGKKSGGFSLSAYKQKHSRPFLRRYYRSQRNKHRKGDKPVVLFLSEQSDVLGSNLTAVRDRMIARGLDQQFTIIESARMASSQHQSQKSWMGLIKKLASADVLFLDDHAPVLDWLKLDDDTKVVQLWHAGAGFKSSGYSRWGHIGCPSPASCHRQYTYGIAGSRHIAHFFSEVWGINTENVLPTGMPRIDEYLDETYRVNKTKELYAQFPLCQGKKVILFAPTYRGKNRATAYYPYELIDFEQLYDLCGDEYVVLFKMHPWVAQAVPIEDRFRDRFVDANTYPNINDLFYITDLLITDYSSNIFEYSLMKRPMLFFAFDKIQYSFSRGFHRDYEESAPGKVCYTFAELLTALQNKDFEYEKVEEYVAHHFDHIDSHASDRVIDWILLDQMPSDLREAIDNRNKQVESLPFLDFTVLEPIEETEDDNDDTAEDGESEGDTTT
ncbi:MAG: CDP-glycerol glycerophosphotransferase family protein [Oscillospiraceae bacterium]|nr:CDP-glycerol glycerophosphotransferase family protein [Oscillospiraceae bacterium]